MPKRPRQHQLEDQSRIAFRKILPPGWVFRDMAPDYGIDGEVEIFDEKENSTGLLFKVQLKSTGKADLKKAMVLIFKRETLRYYISLKMPVLIVQFHAPTDRIFTKWAHTYDAYYEKKASKNLSFRYSLEDEWGLETPQRLAAEVQELRNLDSPQPKLPLSFALIVEGQAIHGLKPSILTIKIRNLLAKIPDLIEIRPTQTNQCHTFIRINKNEVVITLAGKTFFTLHTTEDMPYETAHKNFHFDILLGLGVALYEAGQVNIAARLIEEYAIGSSIIKAPQIFVILTHCLFAANRITEALEISERIFENEEDLASSQLFMLPAILRNESLSTKEMEFYHKFLERRVERAQLHVNNQTLAAAHYNLGNYLRKIKPRLALNHYREAARHDLHYWKRSYFLKEMGGILFGAGRYNFSARLYREALRLGDETECHALLADALFFAGQYKDAQESFEYYLAQTPIPNSEWKLKKWVLSGLRPTVGVDQQKRRTSAALKLIHESASLSPDKKLKNCTEALSFDALCPAAWHNLGNQKLEAGDVDGGFLALLIAAIINKHHLQSWVFSVAVGLGSKTQKSLLTDTIRVAYQVHGEEFLKVLIETLSLDKDFPVDNFLKDVYKALGSLLDRNHVAEFRCLSKGATYSVLRFKNSRLERLAIPLSYS